MKGTRTQASNKRPIALAAQSSGQYKLDALNMTDRGTSPNSTLNRAGVRARLDFTHVFIGRHEPGNPCAVRAIAARSTRALALGRDAAFPQHSCSGRHKSTHGDLWRPLRPLPSGHGARSTPGGACAAGSAGPGGAAGPTRWARAPLASSCSANSWRNLRAVMPHKSINMLW